jgi:hypothetical protein
MSGTLLTIIVVAAAVLVVVLAIAVWRASRRRTLRKRFGPEYDHAVETAGGRRAAERDLRRRASQRDELNIRDLPPAAAARYQEHWMLLQQQFVDGPVPAVHEAQALVTRVMRERGYPTSSADEREALLSVDHAEMMDDYRSATSIEERSRSGGATTEELRQAMQHYRSLFEQLLGDAVSTNDAYPEEAEQAPAQAQADARKPSRS